MPLSLTAAVLSGGGYAAYVGGLSGFLAVMPEMAVTSLLLSVPLKLLPAPGGDSTPSASVVALKTPEKTEEESLACLSGALGAVAAELKTAAEREKTASPEGDTVIFAAMDHTARSTLLERRHLVQAYTWHGVPLTTALTRFTLGFQARLERLWEWDTLIPKVTPLPQ